MKLGSFAYLAQNFCSHLSRKLAGMTKYSPSTPLTSSPLLLQLIMQLYRFWATSLVYSFFPSLAITRSLISQKLCGLMHSLTVGRPAISGRRGKPVLKMSEARLLATAPRYCRLLQGGTEQQNPRAMFSGRLAVRVRQMLWMPVGLGMSMWQMLLSHWNYVIGGRPGRIIVKGSDDIACGVMIILHYRARVINKKQVFQTLPETADNFQMVRQIRIDMLQNSFSQQKKQNNNHGSQLYCKLTLADGLSLELTGEGIALAAEGKGREWLGNSWAHEQGCSQQGSWKYRSKCRDCYKNYSIIVQLAAKADKDILHSVIKDQAYGTFQLQLLHKVVKAYRHALHPQSSHRPQNIFFNTYALACSSCGGYWVWVLGGHEIGGGPKDRPIGIDLKMFLPASIDQQLTRIVNAEHKTEAEYLQSIDYWIKNRKTKGSQARYQDNYKYSQYSIDLTKTNKKDSLYKLKNGRKLVSDRSSARCFKAKDAGNSTFRYKAQATQIQKQGHHRQSSWLTVHNAGPAAKKASTDKKIAQRSQYKALKTQQSQHSKSKCKRWSIDIFAAEAIKVKAKKENRQFLKKEKENQLRIYDQAIGKLKLVRSQDRNGITERGRKSQVPWEEIAEISKEIVMFHVGSQKRDQEEESKDQAERETKQSFNSGKQSIQVVEQSQLTQKEKIVVQAQPINQTGVENLVQLVWSRLNKDVLSRIDPIGETINQAMETCKKYKINCLKQLCLLYKKFFYMRTALLATLLDPCCPALPDIKPAGWQSVLGHPLHQQRHREIEQQNEGILRSLVKMQKKVQERCKDVEATGVWQLVIDEEEVYASFVSQLMGLNVGLFRTLYHHVTSRTKDGDRDGQADKQCVMRYGKAIILAALDDLEGDSYEQVLSWSESTHSLQQLFGHVSCLPERIGKQN